MNTNNMMEKANTIMEVAKQYGLEENFLFITTFQRYEVQLNILNELQRQIEENGTLVTKEYVKGRENLYTSPAVKDYNNTCASANSTVSTLIKIIKELRDGEPEDGGDELLKSLGIK